MIPTHPPTFDPDRRCPSGRSFPSRASSVPQVLRPAARTPARWRGSAAGWRMHEHRVAIAVRVRWRTAAAPPSVGGRHRGPDQAAGPVVEELRALPDRICDLMARASARPRCAYRTLIVADETASHRAATSRARGRPASSSAAISPNGFSNNSSAFSPMRHRRRNAFEAQCGGGTFPSRPARAGEQSHPADALRPTLRSTEPRREHSSPARPSRR